MAAAAAAAVPLITSLFIRRRPVDVVPLPPALPLFHARRYQRK